MTTKTSVIIGGIVGNVVEWYDFALYGFMIPVLSQVFFPNDNHQLHAIMLVSMFGLSFFMRPIGALIYGYFGDTTGRKGTLIYSVLLMGLPTLLIGCLPSYDHIGYLSPILLLFLRLLQGLAAGGEFGGSITFCLEHAPKQRRSFFSCLPMMAAMIGVALGSLVPTLVDYTLTNKSLLAWGWRLPFLISIFIALIGYFMRRKLIETPVFEALKIQRQLVSNPVSFSIRKQIRSIIKVAFIVAFGGVINYLIIIYVPSYLSNQHVLPVRQASLFSFLSLTVVIICIAIAGRIADRVNRKLFLLSIILIAIIVCWPFSHLLMTGDSYLILIPLLFFAILEGLYFGAMMAYLAEIFPAKIRYTSLSFGYNLGFAFFAGLAPIVASLMIVYLEPALTVSYILFLSGLISMIGLLVA